MMVYVVSNCQSEILRCFEEVDDANGFALDQPTPIPGGYWVEIDTSDYHKNMVLVLESEYHKLYVERIELELSKVVAGVSDCQANLINTLYDSLYKGKE